MRRVLRAPVVLAWLLWNVVLSSWALAKEAVTPGPIGTPVLVRYPMRCRTDVEITALAWAITVTPGTLAVCLDAKKKCTRPLHAALETALRDAFSAATATPVLALSLISAMCCR